MRHKEKVKNNLQKYRAWKQLRQIDLAKDLGMGICTLRKIEQDYYYPKYQVRVKICNYFGINQNQMFHE